MNCVVIFKSELSSFGWRKQRERVGLNMADKIPKVFISYSHDSPEHKRWVAEIATKLVNHGVDVSFDQWDLGLGDNIPKFVEHSVSKADRVLMVCTEQYVRKADEGKGGVGYEAMIVTGELVRDLGTSKFIPVIRQASKEIILPKSMGTRFGVNLSEGQKHEEQFKLLLHELHEIPVLTKPPIGKNPFAKIPSGSETSKEILKSTSIPDIETVSNDAAATYKIALDIARQGDLVAWRKIIRQVKQPIPKNLQNWRIIQNTKAPKTKEELSSAVLNGIFTYAPLFGIALAGVESGRDEFNNQMAVLDEILNPAGWDYAGLVYVADFPLTAAYVYQALYGAMCVLTGQFEIATKFARSKIKIRNSDRTILLYQYHHIIGWPPTLGENCTDGWGFLSLLSEKWTWLKGPFGEPIEYKAYICAYYMILNILEFVDTIAAGNERIILQEKTPTLDIPLCFLQMDDEVKRKAYRLLLNYPDKIKNIWQSFGIKEEKVKELWPHWMRHIGEWLFQVYHWPSLKRDIILNDLISDLS